MPFILIIVKFANANSDGYLLGALGSKDDISAAFVILVALILASYIGMSTSSSGICFVARARASNTNDSFGIPSRSKQTLKGQEQRD